MEEKKNYLSKKYLRKGIEEYQENVNISAIDFFVHPSLSLNYIRKEYFDQVKDVAVNMEDNILMYLVPSYEIVDSKKCYEVRICSKNKIYFEEDMSYAFAKMPYLLHFDGTRYVDTSDVVNMEGMFEDCPNIRELCLEGFNTSKVTNMSYMFNNCSNLENLDLSSFDVSSDVNIHYMFNGSKADCNNHILEGLYLQYRLEQLAVIMMRDYKRLDADKINTIIKATGLSVERLLELADKYFTISKYVDIVKYMEQPSESVVRTRK